MNEFHWTNNTNTNVSQILNNKPEINLNSIFYSLVRWGFRLAIRVHGK